MKHPLVLLSALMALTACGGGAQRTAATEAAETEVAAAAEPTVAKDLAGSYAGVLPAADCPGISVELTLYDDGSYKRHAAYLERDTAFDEYGRYTVEGALVTLYPDEGDPDGRYRIEADRLRMLDTEGNAIEGELSDCYLLEKTNGND